MRCAPFLGWGYDLCLVDAYAPCCVWAKNNEGMQRCRRAHGVYVDCRWYEGNRRVRGGGSCGFKYAARGGCAKTWDTCAVQFVLSRRKPSVDIYLMRLPGQPLHLCMTDHRTEQ